MRFTIVVQAQHIGNAFKQIWKVQHKRKVLDFGLREQIEAKGTKVVDAVEFLNVKRVIPSILPQETEGRDLVISEILIPKPREQNHTHPDWHDQPCRIYNDHSSLFTGIDEGLHVAKTCLVANNLPDRVLSFKAEVPKETHERMQRAILSAHSLDALQEKLPREVNIKRPGWSFPRSYGLPRWRRNVQLVNKMFHTMDLALANQNVDVTQQQFTSEISVKAPLTLDGQPSLFESRQNQLVFGKKPLQPYVDGETKAELLSKPLPSIYPLSRSLSIHERNIYRREHKFPVQQGAPFDQLTMAIFFINKPFMKYTGTQVQGRLLLHSFSAAAAYAQQRYGKDVKELPEQLTINCVQTDSRNFYFGCFQLHSLDLDSSEAAHNLFWVEGPQPMFAKCDYVNNQPVLEGYNPEVLETLMALYKSQTVAP
ncbi:hypothetical protein GHT06_021920 [Daphnia sinensis]|uniref:39S ribosomal protein L37, mitochondrial n=1 Tax=Daphnia sinensis TaxID=1820382 RepID=A0AAD5KHR6_9CRUS|nr:hypothetical protein GHT06_021920 [Daphnia sinensis]